MTPELQAYYEGQLALFGEKGWRDLMDDFRAMKESTDKIAGVKPEDVRFRQGELSIINLVLSREEMCRATYDSLKEKQNGNE